VIVFGAAYAPPLKKLGGHGRCGGEMSEEPKKTQRWERVGRNHTQKGNRRKKGVQKRKRVAKRSWYAERLSKFGDVVEG